MSARERRLKGTKCRKSATLHCGGFNLPTLCIISDVEHSTAASPSEPSTRPVKAVAPDLVGQSDTGKTEFVGGPALIPPVPRQRFSNDMFFKTFDLVLERCAFRSEAVVV